MASASIRLLTLDWNSAQRRALVRSLDPRQATLVVGRLEADRLAKKIEGHEAKAAVHFVKSGGDGSSYGLAEHAAACLFGNDPAFRMTWQAIRRMAGTESAQATADGGPPVRGSHPAATSIAMQLRARSKGRGRARKKPFNPDDVVWTRP